MSAERRVVDGQTRRDFEALLMGVPMLLGLPILGSVHMGMGALTDGTTRA